ncbi:hypothetical protein B7486_69930, partial [cyanobacterium TDX16]
MRRAAGVAGIVGALVLTLVAGTGHTGAAPLDCTTETVVPAGTGPSTSRSIVSADATTVVFSAVGLPTPSDPGGTGQVGAYDVATGEVEWLDLPDGSAPFAVSPDGRRVVSSSPAGWHLLDRDAGLATLVLDGGVGLEAGGVDWRGDGVLLASQDDELERIDLETGSVLETFVLSH